MDLEKIISDYGVALLSVDQPEAKKILDEYFNSNKDMQTIETIIGASLKGIGEKWEKGEASLAQVYMAGLITERIVAEYLLVNSELRINAPKMAICVLDDYHALGKRMVLSIIKSHGYIISDFGQGLSVDEIVNRALDNNIELLFISTLMFASALKVKDIKEKFDKANSKIKIIVGGAPFRLNSSLWEEVGAYAKGDSASDVISIIEKAVKL